MDPGPVERPRTEEVLTTWPPSPWASIRGTKAWMPCTTPSRLTPRTQSQSFSVVSVTGPPPPATPALLQRTWTGPNLSSTASASSSTDERLETSVTKCITSVAAPTSSAARASGRSSMSASTTCMPSAAKRSAMARPIPLAAPVTTAVRPGINTRPSLLTAHGTRGGEVSDDESGVGHEELLVDLVAVAVQAGPEPLDRLRTALHVGEVGRKDVDVLQPKALEVLADRLPPERGHPDLPVDVLRRAHG